MWKYLAPPTLYSERVLRGKPQDKHTVTWLSGLCVCWRLAATISSLRENQCLKCGNFEQLHYL